MADIHRVYVIQNTERRFYVRMTDDTLRRLQDHNSGFGVWTKYRGPRKLRWASATMSITEAWKLENFLKRQKGGGGFFKYTGLSRGSEGSYSR